MLVLTVVILVLIGVPLVLYGRWAGWSFGLRWWGRPTPARVLAVTPLRGAQLTGHSEQSLVEQKHRVALRLSVEPDGKPAHAAEAIAWQDARDDLGGRVLRVRVSRTRPNRVFVPSDAAGLDPEVDGQY